MKFFPSRKRGVALLFVLGMLTLLLTLAVAFVSVVQLDRKGSLAGVSSVKAEMLTEVALKHSVKVITNYMESVSGVPGGVHIANPRHPNSLFYTTAGVPNSQFITSNIGTDFVSTNEVRQLLGSYTHTGVADIYNDAGNSINELMRANMTGTSQIPRWQRLGTTDAKFCFYATDLSGFANHPVFIDETVTPWTTNVVPARLPRAFGQDIREIDIPHSPYTHAEANFPAGAFYRWVSPTNPTDIKGWPSIADPQLAAQIDPNNDYVLRPIDLDTLQATAVPGVPPALFQGAFKTMGKEYGATASQSPITTANTLLSTAQTAAGPVFLLRRSKVDILYNAFLDYIDADDVSQYVDGKGPQTEAHPAINEVGAVAHIFDYQEVGVGTNVWTIRLYGHMESHYPYYNAPAGPYDVSATVEAALSLDGTPVFNQASGAFTESVNYTVYGASTGNYVLHSLVSKDGQPYAQVVFTNATADIDIDYSLTVTAPQIAKNGVIVDAVMDTTPAPNGNGAAITVSYSTSTQAPVLTPGSATQVANTRIAGTANKGKLVPAAKPQLVGGHEGGVSWAALDARFNWHFADPATLFANQWAFSSNGTLINPGGRPTMGYKIFAGNLTLKGAVNRRTFNLTTTHPTQAVGNDRDIGTFVKNAPMETVGELGFLPYDLLKTIALYKRSAVGANGRYHPVWNYFSMEDPQDAQRHFINPNSNHFTLNGRRTTSYVFEGMRVGATADPALTTGGGANFLQGSNVTTAVANSMANRLANLPVYTPNFFQNLPHAADAAAPPPVRRAYFANVSDIPLHTTLATVANANLNAMKETEIESFHMNSFDLLHTRNNVYGLNILIKTTHGYRHVFTEVWRDPFATQSGGHDTLPLTVTNPSVLN